MPLPKPTVLPEWALDDVQNGINGQWNVIEPPTEKKLTGWVYKEKPNRQYWNWFQRQTSLWIAYFNDNLDFDSDTLVPVWLGLTNQPTTNYFYYSKEGDRVYFTCHITWAGNVDITPLIMTNLPFVSKNQVGLLQSIHVTRGSGPTNAGDGVISALIDSNSQNLRIWKEDIATGLGSDLVASTIGQLIISGFYFIENI